MRTFIRGLGLLALGLGSTWGCSGTTTEGGQTGSVVESDVPARYAQAFCPNMAACCQKHGFAHDAQTCTASIEAQARALLLAQEGLATRYDPVAMGQCLDSYAELLKGCGSVEKPGDICKKVFLGTLAEGAPCKKSSECIDPPNGSAFCENGTCQKDGYAEPVHAVVGGPCAGTCTSQGEGSYSCSGAAASEPDPARCFTNDGVRCDGATKRCVPAPKVGESCSFGEGCAPGGYCDGVVCVPQKATGPCTNREACSSASYCNLDQSQCVPKQADGAACTTAEQCTVDNCENGKCGPNIPVNASLCAGLISD